MTTSVLSVASEVFPLIKTGGLADVAGALPLALAEHSFAVRTLMPGYPDVLKRVGRGKVACRFANLFGGKAEVLAVRHGGLDLLILDAPHLFDRPGGPYVTPAGYDHPDNWARFAALSKAGAAVAQGAIAGFSPDIVHAHDWQAALTPVYLAVSNKPRPRTVVTIHNLAFQGNYPSNIFADLGLPATTWSIEGVEYYGNVGYLKGGLHAADVVTTVSPTYAEEILTPEGGMGLDGLLRGLGDRLVGIVNGIDVEVWDPQTDPAIAKTYSARSPKARSHNKRALEGEFGLRRDDGPIFAVVSRLTWQKGLDLVADVCDDLVERGIRLVVVGSGDQMIEGQFLAAHARHPDRVGVRIGYDETLSHRVQAGADAILIPSRFEPCGLTQLYGLRYGCIPIVTKVGGLADTVIDANYAAASAGVATGIIFSPPSAPALVEAAERAHRLYDDGKRWRDMQICAMNADVSWRTSARLYADLYRDLIKE
ncbi:glycogen synthase GlgA [Aurantimonas sp. C2-6-R+9]|uniref:glycogen synthase GlgA n=1 Tax=unclassified Aurantimonas TaxID=2638230 RepID=UPI002E19734E|nr:MULTISPECIES: glycogen synthase GlgA [unclassified Aurantimonas]MEC5289008.1 glycogen synthase GlgA [Aurantimonas sp. C2-3-R2]MEC5379417.1 glycogen synthase GlgA [Aurantimonas sp. C2-6-R+9]MEC5410170.1 glycogen synthase GlgA [Aurantimonas sp. C2-4-R8]